MSEALMAAVRSHLDSNPRPRLAELIECDQLRRAQALEVFVLVIALPNPVAKDGMEMHPWAITEVGGRIHYEAATLEIVP